MTLRVLLTLVLSLFYLFPCVTAQASACVRGNDQNLDEAFSDLETRTDIRVGDVAAYCVNTDQLASFTGVVTVSSADLPFPTRITVTDRVTNTVTVLDATGDNIAINPNQLYYIELEAVAIGTVNIVGTVFGTQVINSSFTVQPMTLPVTWRDPLTARPVGKEAVLDWSVSEQVDVAGYTVEHSGSDGFFRAVGEVSYRADGQYSTTVAAPAGMNYYRIRQTDLDGAFSLSNVATLAGVGELIVAPNPTTGPVRVLGTEVDRLQVLSPTGRLVREVARPEVDLDALPRGMYLLRIHTADGAVQTRRIVKR